MYWIPKRAWQRIGAVLLLVLGFGLLAGCDSLPSGLENRAEQVPKRISALKDQIAKRRADFDKLQKSPEWAFFKPYAERENWANNFTSATTELDRASKVYASAVQPILDKDESKDGPKLKAELDRLDGILKGVADKSRDTANRMAFLATAQKSAKPWIEGARTNMKAIMTLMTALDPVVTRAEGDYPQRLKDIKARYVPLTALADEAKARLAKAESEYAKHTSGAEADYATFGDSVKVVETNLGKLRGLDRDLRSKLGELYQSYTKILSDMKVEYWVTIGRSSWDSSSDWDNTPDHIFQPVRVSESDYKYLMSLPAGERDGGQGSVARVYHSWGSWTTKVYIDNQVWRRLGLSVLESWPSNSDDDSQFWINDASPRYYHKYTLVNNGKRTETNWVQVDEEDFQDLEGALGMEIESKPYGSFASEKLTNPAPAGMAYVGNPKYGHWQRDPQTGREHWSWLETYAFYSLMFGGDTHHYYYRDEYNTWHRDYRGRRPYYGTTVAGRPQYGTDSKRVATSPRYAKTNFVKSGGLRAARANARAAGRASRSRGPGRGK